MNSLARSAAVGALTGALAVAPVLYYSLRKLNIGLTVDESVAQAIAQGWAQKHVEDAGPFAGTGGGAYL